MNMQGMLAIVLLVGGALVLAYGGFSYKSETYHADVDSLHLSVDETRHVNIPVWAGIGALVAGGVALNKAYCGCLPLVYNSLRSSVPGSSAAIPDAFCGSNISLLLA
jgi:hypothetical protein